MLLSAESSQPVRVMQGAEDVKDAPLSFMLLAGVLLAIVNVFGLGQIVAAFMGALCVAIILYARRGLPTFLVRQPLFIALPVLWVFSAVWSDAPIASLRLGIESLLTVVAAVAIARRMSPGQFITVVFLATTAAFVGAIVDGRRGGSLDGPVLIGFTGSKDMMGLLSLTLAITSLAIAIDGARAKTFRLAALCVGIVSVVIMSKLHVATAIVALPFGMALLIFVPVLRLTTANHRTVILLILAAAFLSMVALLSSDLIDSGQDFLTRGLGKDKTFTGRTVLWGQAMAEFATSPLLGHGYRAFWLSASHAAVALLTSFGATDGRSFHFHNQYLEALADTGAIGGILTAVLFGYLLIKAAQRAILAPTPPNAYALAMIGVLALRSPFETDFLPFGLHMILLFGAGTIVVARSKANVEVAILPKKLRDSIGHHSAPYSILS